MTSFHYEGEVAALFKSTTTITDDLQISVNREFIEGYVDKISWDTYAEDCALLVSTTDYNNGIKVRVTKI